MEELQAGCTKELRRGSRGTKQDCTIIHMYIYIYIEREGYVYICLHSTADRLLVEYSSPSTQSMSDIDVGP